MVTIRHDPCTQTQCTCLKMATMDSADCGADCELICETDCSGETIVNMSGGSSLDLFSSGGYAGGESVPGESSSTSTLSLLDRLCSPIPSDLARKRKLSSNPPIGGKRSKTKVGATSSTTMKSVSPLDRVREFSKEPFSVSTGKLFCNGCRQELSLKILW